MSDELQKLDEKIMQVYGTTPENINLHELNLKLDALEKKIQEKRKNVKKIFMQLSIQE